MYIVLFKKLKTSLWNVPIVLVGLVLHGFGYADTLQEQPPGSGVLQLEIASPHQFTTALLDSDKYTASFTLNVDSNDVGKQAALFLAARHQNNWYIRTEQGWDFWDANPITLSSFQAIQLESETTFDLFQNIDLLAGDYQVYAAYQAAGEDLVVSSTVMEFEVQSAQKDSLHKFISDTAMEAYIKEGMQFSSSDQIFLRAQESAASVATDSSDSSASSTQVSTTNVQEAGVDEADIIKTDGEILYVLRNCGQENCIANFSLDATQAAAEEIGVYQPEEDELFITADSMYLVQGDEQSDDILVTLSGQNAFIAWLDVWGWRDSQLELEFLDAGDPANLSLANKLTIDGSLISSRRIGDVLYLVSRYTPFIPNYNPYAYDDETRLANDALLEDITLADLTPKATFLNQPEQPLITSDQCYLATGAVDASRSASLITITAIPLSNPSAFDSSCFLGNTETVYMTPRSLYLATTQYEYSVFSTDALFYRPDHKTAIHKFALVEASVEYRGSGEVDGHLGWHEDKRSFRMGANGENDEYLNVVTSIGETWNDSSSTRLSVLKDNAGELQTVDFIDGIGKPGEQLYAARFFGDRAYLVTFRVIDPLYVVDLSDQENPNIAGELEIEGYSDYLHPVDEDLLLGIGKDAIPDDGSTDFGFARGAWYQGVKLSLFDVSDLATPTEINSLLYGKRGSESEVLYDHHGISFLPATESNPARFAIPIQVHATEPDYAWFDPQEPNAWYAFTSKGLYSFEADASGLSQAGYIEADSTSSVETFNFWGSFGDRSVLANDAVFYVHQGEVKASMWGVQP
ncbi:MAG: beta-propeller domain-containing protein [Gammaproteobacteria bacterium]|nr:beta-propeller domain-containing protein [Gammaproteobacteria bacterium]MDP6731580.1 beta-propeller domain-containing protein [Gammaproteobacteria bacterium]